MKHLTVLATLFFCTLVVPVGATIEDGTEFIRGDCDGDGETHGVSDALTMLTVNFIGGEEPPCKAACDVDGDGTTIGVADALELLTLNFLGGVTIQQPYPDCGPPSLATDRVLGCATPSRGCGRALEFETLVRGQSSGAMAQTTIVRDVAAWEEFWADHTRDTSPPPEAPAVDFDRDMVVTVVRHFNSGGYYIQIDRVVVLADEIRVIFTQIEPPDGCPTTDALTQPHHFVRVERTPGDATAAPVVRLICCGLPMDATGVGPCDMHIGFKWNGHECVSVSGCSCEGADCKRLFATPDDCRAAYAGCPSAF